MSTIDTTHIPRYRCHKEVHAAKILGIEEVSHPEEIRMLILEGHHPIEVEQSWVNSKHAKVGGYLVIYSDGFYSFSPAKAFEEGYSLIPGEQHPSAGVHATCSACGWHGLGTLVGNDDEPPACPHCGQTFNMGQPALVFDKQG